MSTWNLLQRSHDGERGASAILVAASLLLLMGFAAIAVDAGLAFSERRQQASAADVGALAALQFAKTTQGTPAECTGLSGDDLAACRGAIEALDVIEGTLPNRYVSADWNACDDTTESANRGYTQASAVSRCIWFTPNLQRARVVLPGTDVDTAFSRPIGFDFIGVGAFAEAGLEMDISGGVLPFALGPSGSSSNQACFFAQDTGQLDTDPCTSSTQGNFGKLDLRWYGNENYEAGGSRCTGSNAWRMTMNIIAGSDHPMEPHTKNPSTIINDVSNCDNITNPVDQLRTWTGNASGAMADGFFSGSTSPTLEGRLMCKQPISSLTANEDYPAFTYQSTRCAAVNNNHPEQMDHSPLWDYIASGANSEVVGGACAPGGGPIKDRAEMEACLQGWRDWKVINGDHTQPLFTKDLSTSPRFGGVPTLNTDPGGGSGDYLITDFKPIYLETLYLKCNANSCDTVHSPGEDSTSSQPGPCPDPLTPAVTSCGWEGNGNKSIEALTAFILTMDMLHPDIADNFPYQDGTVVYNLYK